MRILYSKQDPAGTNVALRLSSMIENGKTGISEKDLVQIEGSLLYSDSIVKKIEDEFIIFASKHKSESGKPSFTIHVPGNWGKAEMGGKDREISFSDPVKMKSMAVLIKEKNKEMGADLNVTLEVDHHGPFCATPCAFIEIGSSEREWKIEKYGKIVGEVISEYEDNVKEIDVNEICIGVGGGHYCPAFNKHEFEGNVAFAHIVPNYAIDSLEYETFIQAFERTTEEIDCVYIDWKGLRQEQRKKIIGFINEYGMEYKRI
ncbi:MAG: D-tyrosyl-tRNA(Tyr) deacylase [Candidatus Micrarchaeota archaeon]|nr:D-tyrosyl-tRNA(Tyr) deacylase [Candidatus Micrarchaeota archaeon]